MPGVAQLITIPFSHFCEKARWALDRAGYPYQEEAHAPGLHRPYARRAGARGSVPVLVVDDGRVLDDSALILGLVAEAAQLFPGEPAARAEVDALVARFDRELGPDVRRLAYHDLLPRRADALRLLTAGSPPWEGRVVWLLFPVLRPLMRRSMRIDATGAARSEARLTTLFADVSARLADGRRWLVGDAFTAADLTFAALSAPALQPAAYAARLGGAVAAGGLGALFARLRDSPAGALAARAYTEERARVLGGRAP
jgi:glutathione S-transferase